MSEASAIISRVNEVLTTAVDNERQTWTRIDEDLETVFDEIESLVLGGGKRLRPQFAHWGWVAAGGDPADGQQFRIGAAIELLHVFALFHDDVIDDAESCTAFVRQMFKYYITVNSSLCNLMFLLVSVI